MADFTYLANQESPGVQLVWQDGTGAIIDFSTSTMTVRLVNSAGTVTLTKTTGVVGTATSPNVTVTWAPGELNLTPGDYQLFVFARDAQDRDRVFRPSNPPILTILAAIA